jgi:hypothetical protein
MSNETLITVTDSQGNVFTAPITINVASNIGNTFMYSGSEYGKQIKKPMASVVITKYYGTLVVDGEGEDHTVDLISCTIHQSLDQGSSSCTLEIVTPYNEDGEYVKFTPMDRVVVKHGWSTEQTLTTMFYGFVDRAILNQPGKTTTLECRDILKLAQDFYITYQDRMVYYKNEFDEREHWGEFRTFGGQPTEDRYIQNVITDILEFSGIPGYRISHNFPEENPIVLGNNSRVSFENTSAFDASNGLCNSLGYRIWADRTGLVRMEEIQQIASETPTLSYSSQEETFYLSKELIDYNGIPYTASGVWEVTQSGTLLKLTSEVSDDLRNSVTVYGYQADAVMSEPYTVEGSSPYVPDPPGFRKTEIRNTMLDTPELISAVALKIYNDLNRLKYTATATIEGDTRVYPGQTINIRDSFITPEEGINYFLNGYSSRFTQASWLMDLELVGGIGEGSDPVAVGPPRASFTYHVETDTDDWGNIVKAVTVDGSSSFDPDSPADSLTYLWMSPGFSSATGVTHTYIVPSSYTSMDVTLIVSDGMLESPPLTLSLSIDSPKTRLLYISTSNNVYHRTQAATWVSSSIGSTVTALAADPSLDYAFAGTSNGDVYNTTDGESWTYVDGTSGDPITAIYMDRSHNIKDYPSSQITWWGTLSGRIFKRVGGTDSGSIYELTSLELPIRYIKGNNLNSSQIVIGCASSIWVTSNSGSYFTLAHIEESYFLTGLCVWGNEIQAVFESRSFRSPDFGTTWIPSSGVPGNCSGLAFSRVDYAESYIGAIGAIYACTSRTNDQLNYEAVGSITGSVNAMEMDSASDGLYIGTSSFLYKSMDGGQTVTIINSHTTDCMAIGCLL